MASIIIIKCLKTVIRNENVLNIHIIVIIFIRYILHKNVHDRTIFIFLKVIMFLKIGCANLIVALTSPLFPYTLFYYFSPK